MSDELTQEDYQAAIDLTPEQKKAFAALKRAVGKSPEGWEKLGAHDKLKIRDFTGDHRVQTSVSSFTPRYFQFQLGGV